jgi:hypothetical protein
MPPLPAGPQITPPFRLLPTLVVRRRSDRELNRHSVASCSQTVWTCRMHHELAVGTGESSQSMSSRTVLPEYPLLLGDPFSQIRNAGEEVISV